MTGYWSGYFGGAEPVHESATTSIPKSQASTILSKLCEYPAGISPHKKIVRFLEDRRDMSQGKQRIDWSAGEALAFGSLLLDGHPIRLTGQDSQRGTFSQRHSVLHDVDNNARYLSLAQ
jgi:2-oxoglutarate dehydrogenase E1 component